MGHPLRHIFPSGGFGLLDHFSLKLHAISLGIDGINEDIKMNTSQRRERVQGGRESERERDGKHGSQIS